MKYILLILINVLSTSCGSQNKKTKASEIDGKMIEANPTQIGQYVVKVFEDSKGNLWLGTIEKGVAKYDGKTLKYFTTNDGLPANRVTGIVEDENGNLWFGTGSGLSKYDGKSFSNFTEKDGLCHNSISNLLIDSKGIFWIGTWGGLCQYDGQSFTTIPLPYPIIGNQINEDTKEWITAIKEDSKGNIWFGRDGYGASRNLGETFTHYTIKQGLLSNNVTEIEEDKDGNIWFGTRVSEKDNPDPKKRFGKGGVNRLDFKTIISFPKIEGFNRGDVYEIYRDNSDNIWISTTKNGVYKYDGTAFTNYNVPISIMSIQDDKKGNLWLGGAGGLYKINSKGEVVNVTTEGPWN